jgi:hypothetical protein
MTEINLSDTATLLLFLVAVLVVVLCGLVVYLLSFLSRIELILWRMRRDLRPPEVPRDNNGQRLRERL